VKPVQELVENQLIHCVTKDQPDLLAAWQRQECTDAQFKHLAGVVTRDTCAEWLEALRTMPRDEFDALLLGALEGQRPNEATPRRRRQTVTEIATPGGPSLKLDVTLRLPRHAAAVVHRALDLAGRKGKCTPTVGRALKVWLERCDRELRAGAAPPTGHPSVDVMRCPWSGRSWYQTRWGNLGANERELPLLDSDQETHVQLPSGQYVAQNPAALLDAFNFLSAPARSWRRTDPDSAPGDVRWGIPVPLSDSTRRLLTQWKIREASADPAAARALRAQEADAAAAPLEGRRGGRLIDDASGSSDEVRRRAERAQRWLAKHRPDFSGLTLEELQAIAAAALRRVSAWRYRELELLRGLYGVLERGGVQAVPFLATLGLSPRTYWDGIRIYHKLEEYLPRIRQAFIEGRLDYAKVRLLVRRAVAATERAWLDLALAVDEPTLAAHVAVSHVEEMPPLLPRDGAWPITPDGGRVRVRLQATLTPAEAAAFRRMEAAMAAAGRESDPAACIYRLAAWYLVLEEGERPPRVIYQLSPQTRARAEREGLGARGDWPESVAARLAHCFPHLPWLADPTSPRHQRALERADREVARRQKAIADQENLLAMLGNTDQRHDHVPDCIKDAVRWRDGERCCVPGCGNTMVLQYDHFFPVAKGGRAILTLDRRLCGPCNRARWAGLLIAVVDPDGRLRWLDRRGRAVGVTDPTLGREWEAVLDAWAWDAGRADLSQAAGWLRFLRQAMDHVTHAWSPGPALEVQAIASASPVATGGAAEPRPASATGERGLSVPSALDAAIRARAG